MLITIIIKLSIQQPVIIIQILKEQSKVVNHKELYKLLKININRKIIKFRLKTHLLIL